MNDIYIETAKTMVRIAPLVFTDERLALKGGTAINLFLRDMPRLSVDLDLTFTDYTLSRSAALAAINDAISSAQVRLKARGIESHVPPQRDGIEAKLLATDGRIQVKVEINYVIRGAVDPVERRTLTRKARDLLLADLELQILSPNDIYGGKLVAALDRQHPRDLFDVMQLFENEGITSQIRRCFIVYLVSHNRPIHEVLFPAELDISHEYNASFRGMTSEEISLPELLSVRTRLLTELPRSLTGAERQFLLSVAYSHPKWNLIDVEHIQMLPAVKWKVQNLKRLAGENRHKLLAQADELARRFAAV
jgi:predicted nucleotidyltransferase component of viral defense system